MSIQNHIQHISNFIYFSSNYIHLISNFIYFSSNYIHLISNFVLLGIYVLHQLAVDVPFQRRNSSSPSLDL